MKKLLALLMACTTITCAFASCGDNDDESSTSGESSVSQAATEAETDAATEAETTTEAVTEEETTEAVTESDAEEETTGEEDGGLVAGDTEFTTHAIIEDADKTAFIGKWQGEKVEYDGEVVDNVMGLPVYALFQYEFKEDGTVALGETLTQMTGMEITGITWGVIGENEIEVVNAEQQTSNVFKLDGDYLIAEEQGQVTYLAKVDDFTPFDLEGFMNDFQLDGMEEDTSASTADTTENTETTTAEESAQ